MGVENALNREELIRFLTVTSPGVGSEALSLKELGNSWNRLALKLRRDGVLREYLSVVELTEKGAPHLHILATGEYIKQARLSQLAQEAGFGRVADIRAIRGAGPRSASGYLVKSLASYATKSNVAQLADKAKAGQHAKRRQVRPVRMSRNWYIGGMAAAEKAVAAIARNERGQPSDPGPWWMVLERVDGGISVLKRPEADITDDRATTEKRALSAAPRAEGVEAVEEALAA
jgi:hypothetical protein